MTTTLTIFQRATRGMRVALSQSSTCLTGAAFIALGAMSFLASGYLPGWLPSFPGGSAWIAVGVALLLALGFAFSIAAVMRFDLTRPLALGRLGRLTRWAALPLLVWALLSSARTLGMLRSGFLASMTQSPPQYRSDELYYNQYNAILTLRGDNPYTDSNTRLIEAMKYFHIRGYTPIARGQFARLKREPTATPMLAPLARYFASPNAPPSEIAPDTLHSYPAGSFLVDVPIMWAGLPGDGAAQIALFLALVVAVTLIAPPDARLPILLLALCNPNIAVSVSTTDFDIWWIVPLVGAWTLQRRSLISGALLGVACSVKQTAWFFAPFYFLWVWREHGLAEASRRSAFAIATFTLINAPWIIASPQAWARSLALPMMLPLFPQGSGLVGLMLSGALPPLPPQVFTALEVMVWLGAMVWFWRVSRQNPYVGLLAPLVPLMFAWRSPERYFLPVSILAVAALALMLRRAAQTAPSAREPSVIQAATTPA